MVFTGLVLAELESVGGFSEPWLLTDSQLRRFSGLEGIVDADEFFIFLSSSKAMGVPKKDDPFHVGEYRIGEDSTIAQLLLE